MRFEDLCSEPPEATVERIYEFFELRGDVAEAAAAVRPPRSLGRWQKAREGTLADLRRPQVPTLQRFGYQQSG